jgi:hypothetical protein
VAPLADSQVRQSSAVLTRGSKASRAMPVGCDRQVASVLVSILS